jgi:orotate phosphoribosyltransferase
MQISEDLTPSLYQLVSMRRGHFRLESGHHSPLWLDLDGLFAEPRKIDPLVAELAAGIRDFDVAVVCGPLVGGAFLAQLVARILEVDFCKLRHGGRRHERRIRSERHLRQPPSQGADPVVAGALLVLGSTGASYLEGESVPLVTVLEEEYPLWDPASCPLCDTGMPLEDRVPPSG